VEARHPDVVEREGIGAHLADHGQGLFQDGKVGGARAQRADAPAGRGGIAGAKDQGAAGLPDLDLRKSAADRLLVLFIRGAQDDAGLGFEDRGADLGDLLGALGAGVDDLGDALAFGAS
jgi:hypothetical protein